MINKKLTIDQLAVSQLVDSTTAAFPTGPAEQPGSVAGRSLPFDGYPSADDGYRSADRGPRLPAVRGRCSLDRPRRARSRDRAPRGLLTRLRRPACPACGRGNRRQRWRPTGRSARNASLRTSTMRTKGVTEHSNTGIAPGASAMGHTSNIILTNGPNHADR